ncbi:hypothetical protein [Actinoplanes awajinensis]|uniref:Uncharacterized protein n=1 Tax=Actinoplanes awajinensis subsp. mycoplanecinus TaxID=135947 RepID=A0A101JG16_9ACTN|nr:hypothetical protein [Actinoplanes awajinensis]KUL26191.1 hypothetical protein ADL15_38965 [Actinoplanes awajinensis subsp. mycoplanecinus]
MTESDQLTRIAAKLDAASFVPEAPWFTMNPPLTPAEVTAFEERHRERLPLGEDELLATLAGDPSPERRVRAGQSLLMAPAMRGAG